MFEKGVLKKNQQKNRLSTTIFNVFDGSTGENFQNLKKNIIEFDDEYHEDEISM